MAAFLISTGVIRYGIVPRIRRRKAEDSSDPCSDRKTITKDEQWAGFWIGLCETLIIFIFVTADEYGALAIIIGAKEFVRKQKIHENASYYLLGTMVNFTVALLAARLAMVLVAG